MLKYWTEGELIVNKHINMQSISKDLYLDDVNRQGDGDALKHEDVVTGPKEQSACAAALWFYELGIYDYLYSTLIPTKIIKKYGRIMGNFHGVTYASRDYYCTIMSFC